MCKLLVREADCDDQRLACALQGLLPPRVTQATGKKPHLCIPADVPPVQLSAHGVHERLRLAEQRRRLGRRRRAHGQQQGVLIQIPAKQQFTNLLNSLP